MPRVKVQPVAVLEHDLELLFSPARIDDISGVIIIERMVEPPVHLDAEINGWRIDNRGVVDAPSAAKDKVFPPVALFNINSILLQGIQVGLDTVESGLDVLDLDVDAVLPSGGEYAVRLPHRC